MVRGAWCVACSRSLSMAVEASGRATCKSLARPFPCEKRKRVACELVRLRRVQGELHREAPAGPSSALLRPQPSVGLRTTGA